MCIAPTTFANELLQIIEINFFAKMVQLFNLMQIMLLAELTNTSRRKGNKQKLEIIYQLEIIKD